MGLLRYLDANEGDVSLTWKPEEEESVKQAEGEWERLEKAGFEFFEEVEGKKPKRIKKFDAKHGKVLAVPGVQTKADKAAAPKQRTRAMSGGPKLERAL